jgi:hypothetical protein
MSKPYYELGDTQLKAFAANIAARLNETPAAFFVTPELAARYRTTFEDYQARLATALAPETRTKPSVSRKDEARGDLIRATRQVFGLVSTNEACTATTLELLGFSPRKKASPKPLLTQPPKVSVVDRSGWTVVVDLRAADSNRRGRPTFANGAIVLTAVGPEAPTGPEAWVNQGIVTRSRVRLEFDPTLPPGTRVWITAQWYNTRSTSPASMPISTVLAGGTTALQPSAMRAAA